MKSVKQIAFAALLTIGAFGAVTLTSCSKDDDPVVCPTGFEGSDCKTKSRDKFLGANAQTATWKGTEKCTIGTDDYSITFSASSSSDIQLVYTNVYNQQFTATATMTGTSGFSFSGSGSGGVTFSGTGSLVESTGILTINYTILTSGIETNRCEFTGTKI